MRQRQAGLLYLIASFGIIALDRITKLWALHACAHTPIVVHDMLSFCVAYNRGMSFSVGATQNTWLFAALTLFIISMTLYIIYIAYHRFLNHKHIIGECMVIAGAWGNIYDRIMYGGVIDFIEISYGIYSWPTFNIADIAIVGGVGMMVFFYYQEEL